MLVLRYSAYGKLVVKVETCSLIFSARASFVVNAGSSTSAVTAASRSPSGLVSAAVKAAVTSAGSKLTPGW